MTYFCYQGNDKDCGFASLKMSMAKFTRNKDYLNLIKNKKKESYTFSDLIQLGKEHGFTIDAYVSESKSINDIKEGSICVINSNHCVVVDKIKKNTIILLDPSEGKVTKKINNFIEIWDGKILEISEAKIEQKFRLKKTRILPLKFILFQVAFSLILLSLLLVGFLFIDKSENIIISIVILSLIPIVEIADNIITLKIINYFDKTYIPRYFSDISGSKKEAYYSYQDFKKKYLVLYKALSSSAIIIIFICFILAINDMRNLLISVAILLFVFIEKMLFMKSDKDTKKDISIDEVSALQNDDKIDIDLLLKCNKKATHFVRRKSYRKCFEILVCLFLTFVIMFVENTVSANFLIFHFGVYYLLFNNCDQFLEGLFSYQDLSKDEARFRDNCNI